MNAETKLNIFQLGHISIGGGWWTDPEQRIFFKLIFFLKLFAFGRCVGISFVDSTIIPACHNLRHYANKVFKRVATDGKGTKGWCHGLKLHQ